MKSNYPETEGLLQQVARHANIKEFLSTDLTRLQLAVTVHSKSLFGPTLYQIEMKQASTPPIKCLRRYNDFYALHKVLRLKFSLIAWPKFPPKKDLPFNKEEKRRSAFDALLNKMVQVSQEHYEIRQNILKLLFFFMMRDLSGKDKVVTAPVRERSTALADISTIESSGQSDEMDDSEAQVGLLLEFESNQDSTSNSFVSEQSTQFTGFLPDQSFKAKAEQFKDTLMDSLPICKTPSIGSDKSKSPQLSAMVSEKMFDYQSEIPNYGQYVFVRFSPSEEYTQFYARLEHASIFLFTHINQNSFSLQICIYSAIIQKHHTHIEIYHEQDHKRVDITVEGEVPTRVKGESNFTKTLDHKLNVLYNQLKLAIYKTNDQCELQQQDFNLTGKIQIHVKEALNIVNIPLNSLLVVQIKLHPFVCRTKMHVKSDNPQWRQDFIIPMSDTYGILQLELINIVHDGILYKHLKETVIGTADILMADILSYHSDQRIKSLHLPLVSPDNKKTTIVDVIKANNQEQKLDKGQPQLVVSLRNLSSVASIFSQQQIDRYEGEKLEPNFNDVKIHIIRFKRIIGLIGRFTVSLEDIMDQKYPKLTLSFFSVVFLVLLLGDLTNMIGYILFLFLMLLIYQNPLIHPTLYRVICERLLDKIHPDYMVPELMTEGEHDLAKVSVSLQKLMKMEGSEVKIDKDIDKDEDDKDTLYTKIRQMKKQFYIMQVYLTWFTSMFEKLVNLITWKEYKRTLLFTCCLFVIFCVVRTLPFRYLIMVGLVVEWFDGKKIYSKRQKHNYQMGRAVIEYIFKKFASDYAKSQHFLDLDWPNQQIKCKVVEQLKLHLEIHINEEIVSNYRRPVDLIKAISTVAPKLKLKRIIDVTFIKDELYSDLKKACKHRLKPQVIAFSIFMNFCYNIPSEYFRLKHPRKLLI